VSFKLSNIKGISVRVLSKEYHVNCPEGAERDLREAAIFLDSKMREIRNSGRVIGIERIAIMAALNIAHELLSQNSQKEEHNQDLSLQLERLQTKIDEALLSSLTGSASNSR